MWRHLVAKSKFVLCMLTSCGIKIKLIVIVPFDMASLGIVNDGCPNIWSILDLTCQIYIKLPAELIEYL